MPRFETHCGNKRRYLTEAQARVAASEQFRKKGRLLDAYKCRFGEHWHTGGPKSILSPVDEFRGVGIRERKEP